MSEILSRGHRLRTLVRGDAGPPVVMLPSSGLGAKQWRVAMERLAPRRCVALDFLGYPGSDAWSGEGIPDWRVDLEAARALVLRESEPVDLVGHSYGGWLALQIAVEHPERIRRIAVHEPVTWGVLRESSEARLVEDFDRFCGRMFQESEDYDADAWLDAFITFWNAPGVWASFPPDRKAAWRSLQPKVYAEVRACTREREPSSHWAAITHPTLVLVSSRSPAEEREVCRILLNALPDGTRVDVEGDHLAPITRAQPVAEHIAEWLSLR